jgi:hypothetical protein
MSEGGELVHFHDWRAARDRKAATRRLWRYAFAMPSRDLFSES